MNHPQRLSYVDPAGVTATAMMAELKRVAPASAPGAKSHSIRTSVPDVF